MDLVLVDLDLPDGDGTDLIGDLRAVNPQGARLVLTGSNCPNHQARAVAAGAAVVMHKSAAIDELIRPVRSFESEISR